MRLRSRCAEGGWVSKHTAQQIGKEEHQQSTAAMHLTDCSDNRQGKHSHSERGRERRREGAEEGRRGKEGQRGDRQVDERERKQVCFFYWCVISCLYALTTSCHARNKASEIWGAIRGEHQRRGGELQASTQWCGSETILETPAQFLSAAPQQARVHSLMDWCQRSWFNSRSRSLCFLIKLR